MLASYIALGVPSSHTLQHTATHCNTLQRIATHCNRLQPFQCSQSILRWGYRQVTPCNTLQRTVVHCNMGGLAVYIALGVPLSHLVATRCNTLQHAATHCNTLQNTVNDCNSLQQEDCTQPISRSEYRQATHCITLQRTATHCNTLQHSAIHSNTLQHSSTGRVLASYIALGVSSSHAT